MTSRSGGNGAALVTGRDLGPAPERQVALDMARRALPVAPVLVGACAPRLGLRRRRCRPASPSPSWSPTSSSPPDAGAPPPASPRPAHGRRPVRLHRPPRPDRRRRAGGQGHCVGRAPCRSASRSSSPTSGSSSGRPATSRPRSAFPGLKPAPRRQRSGDLRHSSSRPSATSSSGPSSSAATRLRHQQGRPDLLLRRAC